MVKELLQVPTNIDSSQQEPLNVTKILREAFKLPIQNRKISISITLLMLIPFFILVLIHNRVAGSLIEKFEDHEQELAFTFSSVVTKDTRVLLVLEPVFLLFFSLISLFGMILTVRASAVIYVTKSSTVNLQELFLKIRATWKGTTITWLYISILTVAYTLIIITVSVVGFVLVDKIGSMATWFFLLLGFLAAVLYLYLAVFWTLGFIISVLEKGFYGMKAIEKARDLMRGRQIQGLVLMLFLVLLTSPISVLFYLNAFDDDLHLMARVFLGFFVTVPYCIAKIFTYMVYTVFYYECKKSHGERVEIELGGGYGSVSTN
ncbi:hypothetical protein BVC80_1829g42 [Macleaya cordata]|uniref:Transmembrane protein n=1 Tax=Macleaya cordata TaxID=56857 RepID=A0A200QZ29_MACCD|nr:hypothetical protein BVC80_1829g42 [Macleaya cordata]